MDTTISLPRRHFTDRTTIGEIIVAGRHVCFTLEDKVRDPGVKVPKETAIPSGKYRLVIDFSNRYQKAMPHVLDVPMFEGIRIHPGNTDKDTDGCILVGLSRGKDVVMDSKLAFNRFMFILEDLVKMGDVWLDITNEREEVVT